jgi:hypothetical protein|tara:strand:- start:419 stop:1168 length:750 start_codon:yes stop_codon:yes gene_type:complete
MANPTTRQELIDYALRRLGAPVIEINVDEDQLEDRADDALQFYQEYHSDATMRVYLKHQITAADITNKYVSLGENILNVKRVFPIGNSQSSINMFSVKYQLHLNDIYDLSYIGDLMYYEMVQQYVSLLDMKLNGSGEHIRWNRHMNQLHLDVNWETDINEGDYIIVEAMRIVDAASYSDVYNDMFLKQYITALIKQQWGANLIKFEGMQLPGGVTLNGRQIFDDATTELQTIREQMQLNYEMPVDFYVG